MEAIGKQQLASVEALLDGGADPKRRGGGGETPVQAVFVDDPAFLQPVLEHGGDANSPNAVTDASAVSRAILGQHLAEVRLLLKAGADPGFADHTVTRRCTSPVAPTAARRSCCCSMPARLPTRKTPAPRRSSRLTFSIPRNVLNDRTLTERRHVVAWLQAHHVTLDKTVDTPY